jgi:hypothetical protein
MISSIVPENKDGKQNNIVFTASFPTSELAADCFTRAYKRVLNPDLWHELAGTLSANLRLFDTQGIKASRLARQGDFIQIDIPGPGTQAGKGYDWVVVDAIDDKTNPGGEEELFAMRLRPAAEPTSGADSVAHFFGPQSSSTFVVYRQSNVVTVSYHGRNEKPNNQTESAIDNLRNTVVATGAIAGLSEAQWTALTKALLAHEIGG